MLRKIKKITLDEGVISKYSSAPDTEWVFRDFSWNENACKNFDFSDRNVIFGLNGVGKTIFSRLLSYKNDEQENYYKDMGLSVEFEIDKNETEDEHIALFDREYVKDNFFPENLQEKNIKKIMLGEPQIKLLDANRSLKVKIAKLKQIRIYIYEECMKNIAVNIKTFFRGTQYGKNLDVANYEKSKVNRDLNSFKDKIENEILDNTQYINFEQDIDRKSENPMYKIYYPEEINYDEMAEHLSSIPEGEVDKRVMDMEGTVSNWVKLGLEIHADKKEKCEFCENTISSQLIDKLKKHFNPDTNALIQKLENDSTCLEQQKEKITHYKIHIDNFTFFDSGQKVEIEKIQLDFSEKISGYLNAIDNLKEKIQSKKNQIYIKKNVAPIIIETLNKSKTYLKEILEKINRMILIFNDNQLKIEQKMNIAGKKLISHKIAEGMKDFYKNRINIEEINFLCEDNFSETSPLKTIDVAMEKMESCIVENEKKMYNILEFSNKINTELNNFFGYNVLQLKAAGGKISGYEIFRNKKKASVDSLSEGEINVIVFLYFLFSLERTDEQGNKFIIPNTRIIIDDPVSSLDTINFYGMFITMRKKISSARQVFILTHDLNFLERVIYWVKQPPINKDSKKYGCSLYMLEKDVNLKTKLIKMPKVIENSSALFPYLFKKLHDIMEAEVINEDECISAPNMVRTFLEMYVNIWKAEGKSLVNSLSSLWKKNPEIFSVETIVLNLNDRIHPDSHSKTSESFLHLQKNLKIIFKMIKYHDKTFYDAILKSGNK